MPEFENPYPALREMEAVPLFHDLGYRFSGAGDGWAFQIEPYETSKARLDNQAAVQEGTRLRVLALQQTVAFDLSMFIKRHSWVN